MPPQKPDIVTPLIMTAVGLFMGGIFVIMRWLDAWIYFGTLLVGAMLIVNQSWTLVPVGYIGMLSAGIFTKLGWLDPLVFFSVLIITTIILAQQIVSRQFDIGHGSSGQGGT